MVSVRSALLAACLALVAYGAQLAHWVLLSHEVCASHGEIVHGDHHAPHASLAREAPRPAPELAAGAGDDHHDHCTAVANHAAACAVEAPTLSTTLRWQPLVAVTRDAPLVSERLYLLAPKTSPPSVS